MDEEDPAPRAVRIELLGGQDSALDNISMPASGSSGPSRLPAAAMIVALIGVFGGLLWLSNLDGADEVAEPDEVSQVDPPDVEPDVVGDDVAVDDIEADGPDDDQLESFALVAAPLYVVEAGDQLVAAGVLSDEAADRTGVRSALMSTNDGQEWSSGAVFQAVANGEQLVGMQSLGDRLLAFTNAAGGEDPSTSQLRIYEGELSSSAVGGGRFLRASFPVDGHVRTVSTRDGRWAAMVDRRAQSSSAAPPMQTQILTGRVDGAPEETTLIEVAPDEFVSSFAATEDGFYAIVVRLQLGSLSSSRPPTPELREWTVDNGWEVLEEDFTPPGGVSARIIDAGANGIFISWRTDLFRVEPTLPVAEWPEVASGNAVTGVLDDTFTPEASPARVGDGYVIVDRTLGEVRTLWLSLTGALWQRFEFDARVEHVSLLKIDDDGTAILAGEIEEQPVAFLLGLSRSASSGASTASEASSTPAFEPEVQRREIVDGEWSTPVFSAMTTDGGGFVGLSNINGQISLVTSSDGFEVDDATLTDFPFGYFTNEMRTTNAGYHVVGQLGLFEDAVFTSIDGVDWNRFPIERPGSATALEIDHFHRTERAAAMAGSLGWADDLERTELTMMWWNESGEVWQVPPRPCEETVRCSILSLVAVADGVVAAHQADEGLLISKWTIDSGWEPRFDLSAFPGDTPENDAVKLQSADSNLLEVMGFGRVIESWDGGRNWGFAPVGPPNVTGAFAAVSADRGMFVFLSADGNDAWVLRDDLWSRFDLTSVELGAPLAISDGVALFGGGASSGSVVIRFAPSGTS